MLRNLTIEEYRAEQRRGARRSRDAPMCWTRPDALGRRFQRLVGSRRAAVGRRYDEQLFPQPLRFVARTLGSCPSSSTRSARGSAPRGEQRKP